MSKKILSQHEAEQLIKKGHVRLMKHRETAPYIGAMMLGDTSVVDEWPGPTMNNQACVTACTDGVDKYYGREFISEMTLPELCGFILHENLHVFLKQIPRHMDLVDPTTGDPVLLNAAMDYVVNDIIYQITDKSLAVLPNKEKFGGLHDIKFRNWSTREIFNFLRTGMNPQSGKSEGKPKRSNGQVTIGGNSYAVGGNDEHDMSGLAGKTPQQIREIENKINAAIHQAGLLAGRMGLELPKQVLQAAVPDIDWREETREFICVHTRGRDEYTWKRFNKRRLVDDLYLPSTESEKIEGVIIGNDTSGSIGPAQMGEWIEHLELVCTQALPEWVKILWWDTKVSSEQHFIESEYGAIRSKVKPTGGGGTHVGCVSDYINKKKYTADCVVILTDGYTEQPITWDIKIPTLWVVTQNERFQAPFGRVIMMRG